MSNLPPIERETINEDIAKRFTSHVQRLALNVERLNHETVLTSLHPINDALPVPCDSVRFTIIPVFGEHEDEDYEMYEVKLSFGEESVFTLTWEPGTFSALIGDGQDLIDQDRNYEHAAKMNHWIESTFPFTDPVM